MSNIAYFDCLCKCIKKRGAKLLYSTPYKLTQLIIKNEKTKTWKNYLYWL